MRFTILLRPAVLLAFLILANSGTVFSQNNTNLPQKNSQTTLTEPNQPIVVTVAEMHAALKRASEKAAARVSYQLDAKINAIVQTWAYRFNTARANALGFVPDENMDAIVAAYIKEEGIAL